MKKFLKKDEKDTDKETKEEKKEKKKQEKKEKKEKKEKEKKIKKDKRSASSTSLDVSKESDSPEGTRQSTVTTTTITSDSPGSETKMTVVKETTREGQGESVSETKVEETRSGSDDNVVRKTTTTITKPDKPAATKTVVKETTEKTPLGEERVVVTKTTSEVESAPSTREFLEKNYPEAARVERTRHVQKMVVSEDVSSPRDNPSHVSKRTVIREVNDGGQTVKTVTNVVTDDGGTVKTTRTTTSGQNGDNDVVANSIDREADLPDWLENVEDEKRTTREKAKIDDSIQIPTPPIERKRQDKPKPTGPKVSEKVTPSEQNKAADIMDLLDQIGKEQQKESKDKNGIPETHSNKTRKEPAKKNKDERNKRNEKPGETYDVNANITQPDNTKKASPPLAKNRQIVVEDDDDDDGAEVLEEIIVVEKKRRVRFPKSFVPHGPERPKVGTLPFNMLVERASPRRKKPLELSKCVTEIVPDNSERRPKSEIPDLDELDKMLAEVELSR